jgi:hypothetical protein
MLLVGFGPDSQESDKINHFTLHFKWQRFDLAP